MTDRELRNRMLKWFYDHRKEGWSLFGPSTFPDLQPKEIDRICGQLHKERLILWQESDTNAFNTDLMRQFRTWDGVILPIRWVGRPGPGVGAGQITVRGSDTVESQLYQSTEPETGATRPELSKKIFDRSRFMTVEPLFGIPDALIEKLDVFVLMPFKADMLPVYEDHIKPTCTSLGLAVRRADDFFTAHSVVQDIWKAIVSARSIVADCTDRNPNVFYEIGLAHTIGKPTILLTQKSEDIPFDLRHLRYIAYQLTPRGMKEFETKFKETLRNVLSSAE